MTSLKPYIQLLRPHQWVKNCFIFLPLFFGMKITETSALIDSLIAFAAFCAVASAVYIFNDYIDREADKLNPQNRARPFACGSVDRNTALVLMSILAVAGIGTYTVLLAGSLSFLGVYISLNVLYTLKLKHIPIVDVVLIAFGFVLRVFIGSSVSGVHLSMWIVIMTFLLALFLALAKRRNDILIFMETGEKTRKTVDGYNVEFLNSSMVIMASVVIVAYILYTVSPDVQAKMHSDKLYLTAFFVVIGILRYMQITIVENRSGNPAKILLEDRFLQIVLTGWLAMFSWILYFR